MNVIHQFAETWMRFYVIHLLEMSLFIILIWFTDKFLRLQTWSRYLLWILALVKIFVPPVFTFPSTRPSLVTGPMIYLPTVSPSPLAGPQTLQAIFPLLLFGLWISWVGSMTYFMVVKNRNFQRRLLDAKPISNLTETKLSTCLPIYVSSQIQSPVLFGAWKQKLYLPIEWQNWSDKELKSIVAHETAHFHKRDIWVLILQHLAIVLFGVNPLIWLVHNRLNYVRELNCDEMAIQHSGIKPVEYSQLIYSFIEKQAQPPGLVIMGKSFFNNDQSLIKRMNNILKFEESNMKIKSIWQVILSIFLAVLILPFSWKCAEKPSDQSLGKEFTPGLVQPQTDISSEKSEKFQPFNEPPKPIGGFQAIQANIHYPEIARKAGMEETVIVQVYVDEHGEVADATVLRTKNGGEPGFKEAALAAVKKVKWQPALWKGKPVAVQVAIPVIFQLASDGVSSPDKEPKVFQFSIPNNKVKFQPFDEAPQPVGGFTAIQKNLQYPVIARKAGIEGRVVINILVSAQGEIADAVVMKSLGHSGCDEAAINALKSVKWRPAKNKGQAVEIWVAIPVEFKLSETVK